jgi:hypothetical protein
MYVRLLQVRSIRKHKSTKAAAQPKKMKKACVIL